MIRLNSEKFQNFIFKPKWSFLRENQNDDSESGFSDFYDEGFLWIPYNDFLNFPEVGNFDNGYFRGKIFQSHI